MTIEIRTQIVARIRIRLERPSSLAGLAEAARSAGKIGVDSGCLRIFLDGSNLGKFNMAEEKKTAAKSTSKPEKKKSSADAAPAAKAESNSSVPKAESSSSGRNGKGDGPRSIFSEEFRSNYDSIDWGR